MKKLMNTICYVFILLLVILDISVLTYFFDFWTAPVRYYICLGCIAAAIILLLIFQIKLKKRLKTSVQNIIPIGFTVLILLLSSIFLYTGAKDTLAMKKPVQVTVNQTKFFRTPHSILNIPMEDTYCMEGTDLFDQKISLRISEKNYNTYSYITNEEYMEYDPETKNIVYSYKYSEDSKLMAEYLPVSKKVVRLVEITPSSHTYTQTDELKSIEAQITAVLDDRTMEATVTDTGEYNGSHLKEGDTITIQGTMTILYPYNVQGFYEIKEGDLVSFEVDNLVNQDSIVITTSVLNLAENQTKGEEVN